MLFNEGYGERLLLSQDVGHKNYLVEYSGWGYANVLSDFRTMIIKAGRRDHEIARFFLENPARVLAIDV